MATPVLTAGGGLVLTLGAVLPLEELVVEGGQAVDAAREVGTAMV